MLLIRRSNRVKKCLQVIGKVLQKQEKFDLIAKINKNIFDMSMDKQEDKQPIQQSVEQDMNSHKRVEANSCGSPLKHRQLAAFDFDYTVVAQNTDTVVRDLLTPQRIPKQLHDLVESEGWTTYMQEVFRLLHKYRFTPTKVRDTIRAIPEVPGLVRFIKRLKQHYDFDLVIISDSNSIFIEEWLQAHGLTDCFAAIFTNPAHFQEDGLLCIQPYHHQTECKLSAANLCKGKVLEHFVVEQDLRHSIRYDRVIYVGDGNNDICPVLRLRSGDIGCARRGYAMERNLAKNRDKMRPRCQLIHWQNGFDLLQQLEHMLQLEEKGDK